MYIFAKNANNFQMFVDQFAVKHRWYAPWLTYPVKDTLKCFEDLRLRAVHDWTAPTSMARNEYVGLDSGKRVSESCPPGQRVRRQTSEPWKSSCPCFYEHLQLDRPLMLSRITVDVGNILVYPDMAGVTFMDYAKRRVSDADVTAYIQKVLRSDVVASDESWSDTFSAISLMLEGVIVIGYNYTDFPGLHGGKWYPDTPLLIKPNVYSEADANAVYKYTRLVDAVPGLIDDLVIGGKYRLYGKVV